jgi:hypothetical protein
MRSVVISRSYRNICIPGAIAVISGDSYASILKCTSLDSLDAYANVIQVGGLLEEIGEINVGEVCTIIASSADAHIVGDEFITRACICIYDGMIGLIYIRESEIIK